MRGLSPESWRDIAKSRGLSVEQVRRRFIRSNDVQEGSYFAAIAPAGAVQVLPVDAVNGVATVSCSVVRVRALTVSTTGTATIAATVVRVRARSASTTGTATVSAALVRTRALDAAATGVATVTAAVVRTRARSASSTGVATVSAAVVRVRTFAASSAGVATVTAAVGGVRNLTATANGVATVSGQLVQPTPPIVTPGGGNRLFGPPRPVVRPRPSPRRRPVARPPVQITAGAAGRAKVKCRIEGGTELVRLLVEWSGVWTAEELDQLEELILLEEVLY